MHIHRPTAKKETRSIFHYAWPGLIAHPIRLVLAMNCLLASVLLRIVEPWPLQFVIDQILLPTSSRLGSIAVTTNHGATEKLIMICAVALVILATLRAIADYYQTVIFSVVGNQVVSDLRIRVFRHLQTLSLAFHQQSRGGDLTVRLVGDMNMLKDVTVSARSRSYRAGCYWLACLQPCCF